MRTPWIIFWVLLFVVLLTAGILVYLFVLKEDKTPVEEDTDSNSNTDSTSSATSTVASTASPGTTSSAVSTTSSATTSPNTDSTDDNESVLQTNRLYIITGVVFVFIIVLLLSKDYLLWISLSYDQKWKSIETAKAQGFKHPFQKKFEARNGPVTVRQEMVG